MLDVFLGVRVYVNLAVFFYVAVSITAGFRIGRTFQLDFLRLTAGSNAMHSLQKFGDTRLVELYCFVERSAIPSITLFY
jgi:hypothetical protein